MINVSIDNLSSREAHILFEIFAAKKYVFNIDCSINNTSSIRIETNDGFQLFSDLEEYYTK